MGVKCLKKKGRVWKKLLECKLRGPPHFSNDTDCTLILIASCLLIDKLPYIKSNEVVSCCYCIEVTTTLHKSQLHVITSILQCLQKTSS